MKPMSSKVALDASALLALMHQEPGESLLSEYIQYAAPVISAVNMAEVLTKQQDVGIPATESLAMVDIMGIEVLPFDQSLVVEVAQLRKIRFISRTPFGLSSFDRGSSVEPSASEIRD